MNLTDFGDSCIYCHQQVGWIGSTSATDIQVTLHKFLNQYLQTQMTLTPFINILIIIIIIKSYYFIIKQQAFFKGKDP